MNLPVLRQWIKWPATLAGLVCLSALAYWVHTQALGKDTRSLEAEPKRSKDNPGEVTLANEQAKYQLARARAVKSWVAPLTVYGRVVRNPAGTHEVRSAFAGVVREGNTKWMVLGQWVKGGKTLGRVDIRVDPLAQVDWQVKLNDAREQAKGANRVREILEERVKRFQKAPQDVPQRELEEAVIQLREAEAREAAARSNLGLWENALKEVRRSPQPTGSPWTSPLVAPADGEVTELLASPGTAVEAGGVVARLIDFRKLLIRLDFPPEVLVDDPPATVKVQAGQVVPPALRGPSNQPLPGKQAPAMETTRLGLAPQAETASPFTSYFYEVNAGLTRGVKVRWRPGLFVKAEIDGLARSDTPPQPAVSVPVTALLYHQGRAVIYVRLRRGKETTTYARREVQVLGRESRRWILAVSPAVEPGLEVVAAGAQDLLSREFNADTDD